MIPEEVLKECLRALKGRVKQTSLHAFEHLERARLIAEIDPEMAIFRAITAEEEAATALIVSLKQRGYERAKELQIRNHVHKQAAFQFLAIVHDYLGSLKPQLPMGWVKEEVDGEPRLFWRIQLPDGNWARPIPPLHSVLWDASTGKPYHFEREILKFADEVAAANVRGHLKERANARNQLLYATDSGIPKVTGGVESCLEEQTNAVRVLAALTCMIAPYTERGSFAQQCLNAFLYFLDRLGLDDLQEVDYGVDPPPLMLQDE